MWFQLKAYFKFLVHSSNQHGIHSPFVYSLITKCFYDRKKKPGYREIKKIRQYLLNQNEVIKVKDMGAGSRVFTSEERKVSQIAKNAGITWKRSKLLSRLVNYLNIEHIVELGTSIGLGTASMGVNKQTKIVTFEACPETASVANKAFQKFQLDNISLFIETFSEGIPKIPFQKIDLALIDGDHREQPTLEYFEKLLPLMHNDSVFIFDDIHWSPGMEKAWEQIKAHPSVKVSIDTFYWGLVFFRDEQVKEHFVIRV